MSVFNQQSVRQRLVPVMVMVRFAVGGQRRLVGDNITEQVVDDGALRECLGVGVGIVEHIGVAAVAVDGDGAIFSVTLPTMSAKPLTAATVRTWPLSTSVSLVRTLPVAVGSPAKGGSGN